MNTRLSRTIIPNPIASEEQHARFWCSDIGALTESQVFAERTVLTAELSRRIFYDVRETFIIDDWTDRQWLRQRLMCLREQAQQFKRLRNTRRAA